MIREVVWREAKRLRSFEACRWMARVRGYNLVVRLSKRTGDVIAEMETGPQTTGRAVFGRLEGIQNGRSTPTKAELAVIRRAQRWCERTAALAGLVDGEPVQPTRISRARASLRP